MYQQKQCAFVIIVARRNKLYSKWKQIRIPSTATWSAFRTVRNNAAYFIRTAKWNFNSSKLSIKLPPRNLWQIGISGNKNSTKCYLDPAVLNEYFLSNDTEVSSFDFATNLELSVPRFDDFEVVTDRDVIGCVAAIKPNSTGEDGGHFVLLN